MRLAIAAQDVRHSIALALRARAFNLGIVATVALITASATCCFIGFYGTFLRRLPFDPAGRLVMLWETNRETGVDHLPVMEGAYGLYRERAASVLDIAAFIPANPKLPPDRMSESGEIVHSILATPELFGLLGAHVAVGRTFFDSEGQLQVAGAVLLSYRFWQREFGGKSDIVGRQITISEFGERRSWNVVGVLAEGFEFPYPLYAERPDVWLCLPYHSPRFSPGNNFYVIGKMADGLKLPEVQKRLDAVCQGIAREQPRFYGKQSITAVPLRVESVRNAGPVMFAFVAALLLVTLIGSSHIVHLVSARTLSSRREIAVRLALGARRTDIFRLACFELGILITAGAAAGLLLAVWALRVFTALMPAEVYIPRAAALIYDVPVIVFVGAICLAGTLIAGLATSGWLRELDPNRLLHDVAGASSRTPRLLRRAGGVFLIVEVAFAFALQSGALATLRSAQRFIEENSRIDPHRLLLMDVSFDNDAPDDRAFVIGAYQRFLLTWLSQIGEDSGRNWR